MDGRAFLDVAQRLAKESTEADWRTAAGRAYYALLEEGRLMLKRWGFTPGPREPLHSFVRLRFVYATDQDLKDIGWKLDDLVRLRNKADYQLEKPGPFASDAAAQGAVSMARDAIALLDGIDGDPTHRAAAIAGIRP
jgi:hypothetical protein